MSIVNGLCAGITLAFADHAGCLRGMALQYKNIPKDRDLYNDMMRRYYWTYGGTFVWTVLWTIARLK